MANPYDSELIRRAIAKEKGLPYVEVPSSPPVTPAVDNALAAFDAAQAPGVDSALQSFDAAQQPAPVTPVAVTTPAPLDSELAGAPAPLAKRSPLDSEIVQRAIAKEKGVPYEPRGDVVRVIEPKPVVRTIEPRQEPAPTSTEAEESPFSAEFQEHMKQWAAQVRELERAGAKWRPEYNSHPDMGIGAMRAEVAARRAPSSAPAPVAAGVSLEPESTTGVAEPATDVAASSDLSTPATAPAAATGLTLEPTIQSAQSDLALITSDLEGAMGRLGEANERDAAERKRIADKMLEEYDADRKRFGDEEKAALAGYKRTMDEFRALNDEMRKLPPIKDGRSGTDKLMGGIAVGLGQMTDQNNLVAGLMQGMNVQTNNAAEIQGQLNTAVERDLAIQRENLANKRANARDKLTELGVAQQYLGDTQQANRFAAAMRKDRYAIEMESQAAALDAGTARDKAIFETAKIRSDARKEMNDILQTEMGSKAAAFQAIALGKMTPEQAAQFITGGGTGAAAEAKALKTAATSNKSQEQLAQGYHEAGAKLAPGLFVADQEIWNRKKTEDKNKELATDYQSRQLRRQLQDMRDFVAANPDYATDLSKRSTLESKRSSILGTYKDAKELGALDGGVERVVNRAIGDPTGAFDTFLSFMGQQPTALARLDEQIREADVSIRARRENNGLGNAPPEQPADTAAPARPAAAARPARPAPAKPATPASPAKPKARLSAEDL